MIHPNRTSLLRLKEKRRVTAASLNILKARRQALMEEFLAAARPFLTRRRELMALYGQARRQLAASRALAGEAAIIALGAANRRVVGLEIEEKNVLGAKFRTARLLNPVVRSASDRYYAFGATTPHLEETFFRFEQAVEELLAAGAQESMLRNLGAEIQKTSRKCRMLEERVLPEMNARIRQVSQHIGEREREEYFRLKQFKDRRRE